MKINISSLILFEVLNYHSKCLINIFKRHVKNEQSLSVQKVKMQMIVIGIKNKFSHEREKMEINSSRLKILSDFEEKGNSK